jgi:hypothetical protein
MEFVSMKTLLLATAVGTALLFGAGALQTPSGSASPAAAHVLVANR